MGTLLFKVLLRLKLSLAVALLWLVQRHFGSAAMNVISKTGHPNQNHSRMLKRTNISSWKRPKLPILSKTWSAVKPIFLKETKGRLYCEGLLQSHGLTFNRQPSQLFRVPFTLQRKHSSSLMGGCTVVSCKNAMKSAILEDHETGSLISVFMNYNKFKD